MKKMLLMLVLFAVSAAARTMWVRVYYDTDAERVMLLEKGHDLLTGSAQNRYLEYFLDDKTVYDLQAQGFRTDILHPDIAAYLVETYGHLRMTFGEYYTYDEMIQELDVIAAAYPELAFETSIGQTWQGRDIWAIKISDNAGVTEPEPRILISGAHHAREPIGCSIAIDYIYWLLDNYGTNDTATTIVNNTETWFVPVVNPDGYVFNETYDDPWGYGWRKNCRDNNNSGQMEPEFDGVDLNRNYGYMWGYNNIGSSPDPTSEVYRGPEAFSEPETQSMRELCDSSEFVYAMNYHAYGDILLVPWAYIDAWVPSPDSEEYYAMAESMTVFIGVPNNYIFGTGMGTLGYEVNGGSDDWMYGEQNEKPKCIAFSPEVGSSFWQAASDTNIIVTQCNETRPMNIFLGLRAALLGVEETEALAVRNLALWPNPVRGRAMLHFDLLERARLSVSLYDMTGRLVYARAATDFRAGVHELDLNTARLGSGVYFLKVSRGKQDILREKVVVIKE
jgi:hypothetical protein